MQQAMQMIHNQSNLSRHTFIRNQPSQLWICTLSKWYGDDWTAKPSENIAFDDPVLLGDVLGEQFKEKIVVLVKKIQADHMFRGHVKNNEAKV